MKPEPVERRWLRPAVGLVTVLLVALLLWRLEGKEQRASGDAAPAGEAAADAAEPVRAGSGEGRSAAGRLDVLVPGAADVADGSAASLEPFGSLAGIAVDSVGEPIAGVTVAVAVQADFSAVMALERGWLDLAAGEPAATTTTDADGFFRFAHLPAAKTVVVAWGAGVVR